MSSTWTRLTRNLLLPALSGLLLLLSFPSFSLSYVALCAWIPLLASLEGKGARRAFQSGWITGVLFYGFLIYWLNYVTTAGYTLLVLYLSLYPAVFCLLLGRLRGPVARPFWGGLLWTGMEYLRSIGPWSFSWGLLGHTQWATPQLSYSARWWGVYGLSFLLMAMNLCLVEVWVRRRRRRAIRNRWLWPPAILILIAVLGQVRNPGEGARRPLRVALLQGNYPQDEKWEATTTDVLECYLELSREALEEGPDLIVWPETAIPDVLTRRPEVRAAIQDWVSAHRTSVLFGSVAEEPPGYYNSAFLVSPVADGKVRWQRYDKVHLVPYGEKVPFKRLFPFLERIVESRGGGEYEAGSGFPVFEIQRARFGVLICFESTIPTLARQYALQGIDFLVVITNDAWFGPSTAPYQHALQSAFRAVETGVPVVRSTNTGWTCAFDARGRLIKAIPIYERGFLTVDVQVGRQPTLYTRWGDLPMQLALGLMLGCFLSQWLLPPGRPAVGRRRRKARAADTGH